jgi:hypothetical protein
MPQPEPQNFSSGGPQKVAGPPFNQTGGGIVMEILNKAYRTLFLAVMSLALIAPLQNASAKPYYEGKTITILLGVGPGSGGTTLARLYAVHLAQAIPGNPNVIVKNMPGAGFMKAHHYIMNSAPDDGTVIYYGPWKPLAVLLKQPGHDIKYTDYTILGGITLGGLVLYARKDSLPGAGAHSAVDLVKAHGLKYGGSGGPAHVRFLIAAQTLDLLGLDWRPIVSYKSNGQSRAAVIKGEVQMSMEPLHGFNNRLKPQLIDTGQGFAAYHIPLPNADGTLSSNPLTPDIPSFLAVYKGVKGGTPSGITWEAFRWLLNIEQNMVHLFFGPPNMKKEPTEILRKVLVPALSSEAFRKEAKKVLTFAPIPGDVSEATNAVKRASAMSPEVFKYIEAYVAKNSK